MQTIKFLLDCTNVNSKAKTLGANFEPVLSVEIDVDATEIPEILDIIGIKKIVELLKDELLDEIGSDYCFDYFFSESKKFSDNNVILTDEQKQACEAILHQANYIRS